MSFFSRSPLDGSRAPHPLRKRRATWPGPLLQVARVDLLPPAESIIDCQLLLRLSRACLGRLINRLYIHKRLQNGVTFPHHKLASPPITNASSAAVRPKLCVGGIQKTVTGALFIGSAALRFRPEPGLVNQSSIFIQFKIWQN